MLPPSHREEYFTLIHHQAQEKLLFMEEELLAEDDLCEKVATIHTETMTRCLASEESKHLFPLLRNCRAKLARSRAAALGKRVYENIAKHEATPAEMRTPWSLPCPIKSSTGSPTGLGIGAAPLWAAATVRSHAPGSTWPAQRSAPTWSQRIPQQHQQRPTTCPYCHICAGYPRKIQQPPRHTCQLQASPKTNRRLLALPATHRRPCDPTTAALTRRTCEPQSPHS